MCFLFHCRSELKIVVKYYKMCFRCIKFVLVITIAQTDSVSKQDIFADVCDYIHHDSGLSHSEFMPSVGH